MLRSSSLHREAISRTQSEALILTVLGLPLSVLYVGPKCSGCNPRERTRRGIKIAPSTHIVRSDGSERSRSYPECPIANPISDRSPRGLPFAFSLSGNLERTFALPPFVSLCHRTEDPAVFIGDKLVLFRVNGWSASRICPGGRFCDIRFECRTEVNAKQKLRNRQNQVLTFILPYPIQRASLRIWAVSEPRCAVCRVADVHAWFRLFYYTKDPSGHSEMHP